MARDPVADLIKNTRIKTKVYYPAFDSLLSTIRVAGGLQVTTFHPSYRIPEPESEDLGTGDWISEDVDTAAPDAETLAALNEALEQLGERLDRVRELADENADGYAAAARRLELRL